MMLKNYYIYIIAYVFISLYTNTYKHANISDFYIIFYNKMSKCDFMRTQKSHFLTVFQIKSVPCDEITPQSRRKALSYRLKPEMR